MSTRDQNKPEKLINLKVRVKNETILTMKYNQSMGAGGFQNLVMTSLCAGHKLSPPLLIGIRLVHLPKLCEDQFQVLIQTAATANIMQRSQAVHFDC